MTAQPIIEVSTESAITGVERDLWTRYRASHSATLREQIVEHYAPLIKHVMARLPVRLPAHVDQDDLVGYGAVGLLEAVDRFDPDMGIKFETFARKRIRGAALDALRSQSALSRGTQERVRTISAAYARLEMEHGRRIEHEEVAAELGMTAEELDEIAQWAGLEVLSLDQTVPTQDGAGVSLSDVIGDEDAVDPSERAVFSDLLGRLSHAVERLPERERVLLALYYIEDLTMQEIAEIFRITKPRVCQLHSRALLRLRTYLEEEEAASRGRLDLD
jgi:RNA polymerase sigma factor for flagellar operon FliA